MGIFDKIERRIDAAVNGAFARTFKGEVQPVEIAARLQKEIDAEARLLSREKRLVPNEFTVGLSQHDYDRLTPYTKTLNAEIIPELQEHAQLRGYVFNGPISILFELDRQLATGRFTVASRAQASATGQQPVVAGPTPPRPGSRPHPAVDGGFRGGLVLEVNGIRHPLVPPGMVIGRGTDADLRINDPGISRRHAQITVTGTGEDQVIEIVDLGSTNGISVGGRKVERAPLGNGSRIEIGTTRMLVHCPTGE